LNRIDDALVCYNKMLQEQYDWPEFYKIYQGLGWAYEQKNDLPSAERNYRKALELRPDYKPAQQGLASVQAKQKQRTEDR
jgi:tetratricopeptide (TPR) repeat protein